MAKLYIKKSDGTYVPQKLQSVTTNIDIVQETGQDTGKVMSQKAVTDALEWKQEKLVAGDNITIVGNVISSTGGGPGGSIYPPDINNDFKDVAYSCYKS